MCFSYFGEVMVQQSWFLFTIPVIAAFASNWHKHCLNARLENGHLLATIFRRNRLSRIHFRSEENFNFGSGSLDSPHVTNYNSFLVKSLGNQWTLLDIKPMGLRFFKGCAVGRNPLKPDSSLVGQGSWRARRNVDELHRAV